MSQSRAADQRPYARASRVAGEDARGDISTELLAALRHALRGLGFVGQATANRALPIQINMMHVFYFIQNPNSHTTGPKCKKRKKLNAGDMVAKRNNVGRIEIRMTGVSLSLTRREDTARAGLARPPETCTSNCDC